MSDIVGGETWVDGQTVNGARLNNDLNAAVIQPDFIDSKALTTPVGADHVVIRQASSGLLKKSTVTALNSAGGNVNTVDVVMPSTEYNVTPPGPSSGAVVKTVAWKPVSGNKILASPSNGSSGAPAFRTVLPADIVINPNTILASEIDWSVSTTFVKILTTATLFIFSHIQNGQIIHVAITHNGSLAHWPSSGPTAVRWSDGLEPQPNLATTIFKFAVLGGVVFGWIEAVNLHL